MRFKKLMALLSSASMLLYSIEDAQALAMHAQSPTWHSEPEWTHNAGTSPVKFFIAGHHITHNLAEYEKDAKLRAEKEAYKKYGEVQQRIGKLMLNIPDVDCITTNTSCALRKGYVNVIDFGTASTGGGGGNDTPAILAASVAACANGTKTVFFPAGKYNVQNQFNSPSGCHGLVWFTYPQNITYDPQNNINRTAEIYVNSGFYTTANHIFYNMNGDTDGVIANINVAGDGGAQGIGFVGNSFNYVGSGQAPRFYMFNMGVGGQGTVVGCGLNTSGVSSGYAQPYSGTGNVCGNYVGYRLINVTASENGLLANGNIFDLFVKGGQVSGNACGGVVGANVGTEGVVLMPDTMEENGFAGFSGVCPAGGPAVEDNGPLWEVDTRFQGNNGVAVAFDGSAGYDTIKGTYSADGRAGVQGAQSEFLFTGTLATGISINGMAGFSGPADGLIAANYLFENISGTNTVGVFGGNMDSGQYATDLTNVVAGSLTFNPLITMGQVSVPFGPAVTPADNAICIAGNFWWDTGFIYVCTASGTVKRATLSTY